jgi:long-chain acyl-CoA synthetase
VTPEAGTTVTTAAAATDHRPLVAGACAVLARLGLAPGDRVLTILPNTPATFAVQLACLLEGVVPVPLGPDTPPDEVRAVELDARPVRALVDNTRARGAVALSVPVHHVDEDALRAVRPREPSASAPRTRPMAYTSGTTGERKGVHVGVHDPAWGAHWVDDEHRAFDRRHGERHLVVSPLYHSGPFRFAAVTVLTGGAVAVLPRFDVDAWLSALRTHRPTSLFCVPTHLHRLLSHPDFRADDLASLRLLAHAGAPCPVPLKERVLEAAPEDAVWEFYGSTEGQFTVCPPDLWREAPGTVGRARPGHRLEVRSDDAQPLPAGQVGAVWVHAPSHARWRYFDDPERTAAAWDGDAFTVGDLGHLDRDGRLFLDGRPGDLVISGGVNVYPARVEQRLLALPAVAEAVVLGVPDEEWGERVEAAVVLRDGARLDPELARRELRRVLAPAEVPKHIAVVDELPRTPTGKIRRVGLRDALGVG